MEESPRGLGQRTANAPWVKPPRVQISPPPLFLKKGKIIMRFDVNFQNRKSIECYINDNLVPTARIEVPVEEIIFMMHDIADDFDLVKHYNRSDLLHAAERIISCLEEEA